ncbi:PilZ domain-containing protein [Endozoicomonas sp. SM1973]|uniref:PilZ domain-containing protein n=1 Tax=Spartinivicinus marinus TaxID=2994442 RepID=A0A853IB63_9GAMM|nr:PilZ domain-containing protein [Spartinivicinus marinus]NYZ66777.1 PilZ domain-containing protein [Spartinivicinus marinus]
MEKLRLNDHRRYPRTKVQWSGVIKYRDHIIEVTTVDISVQGIMVESSFKVKTNQHAMLMLNCNFNNKKAVLYAKTRVKQIRVSQYKFNLILIFEEISPKFRNFIDNFVSASQNF